MNLITLYLDKIKMNKPRSFWKLLKSNEKKSNHYKYKGLKLTNKEKLLLSNENPWGLILFKRNIKSLSQIKF